MAFKQLYCGCCMKAIALSRSSLSISSFAYFGKEWKCQNPIKYLWGAVWGDKSSSSFTIPFPCLEIHILMGDPPPILWYWPWILEVLHLEKNGVNLFWTVSVLRSWSRKSLRRKSWTCPRVSGPPMFSINISVFSFLFSTWTWGFAPWPRWAVSVTPDWHLYGWQALKLSCASWCIPRATFTESQTPPVAAPTGVSLARAQPGSFLTDIPGRLTSCGHP